LFAIASVEDLTQAEYANVYNCLGLEIDNKCTTEDQIPVLGYQAEWIMERPYENNALTDLADYNVAWMYDAYALQTNGSLMNYNGANSQDIWMYNYSNGHLLTVPYVWNNSTIQFFWYNWY
jgi:peptidase A4-like protein